LDFSVAGDNNSSIHILVVDDDPKVRNMLLRYFTDEGYHVMLAESGAAMRAALDRDPTDIVLLDLVLPGEDGFALAREIRARHTIGIIMLTGRGDMIDRVVGLEVGADDYITKPFYLREVHARVKSVLRRLQPAARPAEASSSPPPEQIICFDGWRLNLDRRQLLAPDGQDVVLTTGEFDLLSVFVAHANRVLDRDRLMDLTRGRQWEAFDRTIDAQVARLRRKLESDPKHPALIKSVRGVGYVFTGGVEHR
jgi:two-component system phosphate regulon response regulator OmpR